MPRPPVYLDECVDHPLAEALRERGFTVVTARDAGTLGATDQLQLYYASRMGLVLLSYNRAHLQRWHHTFIGQSHQHGGIVLLPQTPPVARRVLRAAMLLDWIGETDYQSRLVVWGDLPQELIRGLRLSGDTYSDDDVRHAVGWL